MDRRKLKRFRSRLNAKKDEILGVYIKTKEYGLEASGEGAQDLADRASNAYAKEVLFSLSNSERNLLQAVDEALERIETGNFATCAACNGDMEAKRLDAVPWAKHCLSCQTMQEQGLL